MRREGARALRGVRDSDEPPGPPPERALADELDEPPAERPIRCAACGHPVTHEGARVSVHGAHEHRRVNPSGVDFHVGCFSEAPGCVGEGTPTSFWTWFPGHAWRLAHCRGCGAHLGWEFTGERAFWGLILPRLRPPDPPGTDFGT